jgi:chromosome segregation ATPase
MTEKTRKYKDLKDKTRQALVDDKVFPLKLLKSQTTIDELAEKNTNLEKSLSTQSKQAVSLASKLEVLSNDKALLDKQVTTATEDFDDFKTEKMLEISGLNTQIEQLTQEVCYLI